MDRHHAFSIQHAAEAANPARIEQQVRTNAGTAVTTLPKVAAEVGASLPISARRHGLPLPSDVVVRTEE